MSKRFFDFGEYRLDTHNQRLLREGETITLTLKQFELLLALVENAGDVVSKDDLFDRVWKDVAVADETLTRNISWLRQKLGDTQFIETVPKRGYRFAATVTTSDATEIIIEEKTLTHITSEETIFVPDSQISEQARKFDDTENEPVALTVGGKPSALPSAAAPSRPQFTSSLFLAAGALAVIISAFWVYQVYFRQTKPKVSLIANVIPFSGAPGYENTPAFSPDGRQLVYAWNGGEREKTDIYVQILGAGEPVRLTDTEVGEHYPVFSPDGTHIAFVREFKTHGEVILIPALGGAERRVARLFSGNYSISFAPDGSSLAVIDTADSAPDKQYAVYLVNLKTGERRRLTVEGEFLGETTPRFAPDGKTLAFVRVVPGHTHDLFVVSTSGSGNQPRQLTFDNKVIHSLAWSADGHDIFFVSTRASNRANLWRVAETGGDPELVATSAKNITNLAVSPDGKRIAYVDNSIQSDIFRYDAGETSPRKFIATSNSEDSPQLSPDGSRLAFLSNRSGKREVWIADATGKNMRQLTDSGFTPISFRFSPDGTRIVFAAITNDKVDIFTQPVEGGAVQRLTVNSEFNFSPDWSADGRWIYFTSDRAGESNIWRIAADGSSGGAEQITKGGAGAAYPAPDGKTLYFFKQNNVNLWRAAADGSGNEELMPEFAANGFTGDWTVTRTGLYFFAKNADNIRQIKVYDFAARQIKIVAESRELPGKTFGGFCPSADGTFVLYSLQDQNASNIVLAELN